MGTKAGADKANAIRRAKKQAAESGTPVDLVEYGQRIMPDGSALLLTEDGFAHKTEETHGATLINDDGTVDVKVVEETGVTEEADSGPGESDPDYEEGGFVKAADVTQIGPAEPPHHSSATDLVAIMTELKAAGLTDLEAMTIAASRLGIQAPAQPGAAQHQMLTPGSGERLGPDPALIQEIARRKIGYVAPKLRTTVTIDIDGEVSTFEMKVRDADYVAQKAIQETVRRRRQANPIGPAEALAIIAGEHKRDDLDFKMYANPHSATGPADAFSPEAGSYQL